MGSSSKSLSPDDLVPSWRLDPGISDLLYPYSISGSSTAGERVKGVRPRPELWDICNGCVLWLPSKESLGYKIIPGSTLSLKEPAFFNHPVLVLDVKVTGATSASVVFAQMTSLGKRPLQDIYRDFRDEYLPVFPSDPHPNSNILLHLEKERPGDGMTTPSYVALGSYFVLDWTAFQCYSARQRGDAFRYRITEDSYSQVTASMAFWPGSWVKTGSLWETFIKNYIPRGEESKGGKDQRQDDLDGSSCL